MGKQKKLEEIKKQDEGDLLVLKLDSTPYAKKYGLEEENLATGYFLSDGKIHSCSGRGYFTKEAFLKVMKVAVDISDGTYLGVKILSYEVVRKYKPKK